LRVQNAVTTTTPSTSIRQAFIKHTSSNHQAARFVLNKCVASAYARRAMPLQSIQLNRLDDCSSSQVHRVNSLLN